MNNNQINETVYPFPRDAISTTELKFLRTRLINMANALPDNDDSGVGMALAEASNICSQIIAKAGEIKSDSKPGNTYSFEGQNPTRTECEFLRARFAEIRDLMIKRSSTPNNLKLYSEIDELLNGAGFRLAHNLNLP